MFDLSQLHRTLINAARDGRFESALFGTPLADQPVLAHPLSFRVVRLDAGPVSLRLHIWHRSVAEQPGFEVHDHSFGFESLVVSGALRERTYRADPDAEGDRAVYFVTYG